MIVNRLVSEILFGFTGLIGIINPIGIAFLFLERTEALTAHERDLLARKVAFSAGRWFAFDGKRRPFLRLGFAALEEREIREAVERMVQAL